MSIDHRLQAVANFVPKGSIIADIGTDHGYLPIELVKTGKCIRAIAGDVNEGPYLAAKRSVRKASLTSKIDVRLGSGLEILNKAEVDIAIFCGMGGNLMVELLKDCPEIVNSLQGLILQPQQGYIPLRKYLYEIGWHIEDEAIAKADNRIYQVILARPGKMVCPSEIELELGPILYRNRPELFAEMVNEFITKVKRSLNGMAKSEVAKTSNHYRELQKHLQELEALL